MEPIPDPVIDALTTLLDYAKGTVANWQNGDVVYVTIASCPEHGDILHALMAAGRPEGVTLEQAFDAPMLYNERWKPERGGHHG